MYRDYVAILPGKLYQGSVPPIGAELSLLGFNLVVLTAEEYQPPTKAFLGIGVLHAPFDDSLDLQQAIKQATPAARQVAEAIRAGARVLVTCHMGLNRSGMVSALALWYLGVGDGTQIVNIIKSARPGALGNPAFVRWLRALPLATPADLRGVVARKLRTRRVVAAF